MGTLGRAWGGPAHPAHPAHQPRPRPPPRNEVQRTASRCNDLHVTRIAGTPSGHAQPERPPSTSVYLYRLTYTGTPNTVTLYNRGVGMGERIFIYCFLVLSLPVSLSLVELDQEWIAVRK